MALLVCCTSSRHGVFDRSAPLPTGGYIEQTHGTSWMAMYTLHLLAIALELASGDPRTFNGVLVEDDGLIPVQKHPVLNVPAHSSGENHFFQVAALLE